MRVVKLLVLRTRHFSPYEIFLVLISVIPVEGRFSTPVQTFPGAHPASCTMGIGSFQGDRPERDADPALPSSAVG
jgi:hypothetical protein